MSRVARCYTGIRVQPLPYWRAMLQRELVLKIDIDCLPRQDIRIAYVSDGVYHQIKY